MTSSSARTTFARDGSTGNVSLGHQRPSAERLPAHRTNGERQSLLGVGSQTFGTGGVQYEPYTIPVGKTFVCPYHDSILQEDLTKAHTRQGLGLMDRYLAEGQSERYAISHQSIAEGAASRKNCRCTQNGEGDIHAEGHTRG